MLAKKAHGFGIGKWMGFGGKLEPGETTHACALRELEEETGVALQEGQVEKIGLLLFTFGFEPEYFLEVHVYQTFSLTEIKSLCSEFQGKEEWYTQQTVPCQVGWPTSLLIFSLVVFGILMLRPT